MVDDGETAQQRGRGVLNEREKEERREKKKRKKEKEREEGQRRGLLEHQTPCSVPGGDEMRIVGVERGERMRCVGWPRSATTMNVACRDSRPNDAVPDE